MITLTQSTRLLILCKTYPSPSARYTETSCVAAMSEEGQLLRIFPVPFRLMQETEKFQKWQWISAIIQKAKDDHRPESYRIDVGSIQFENKPIVTNPIEKYCYGHLNASTQTAKTA